MVSFFAIQVCVVEIKKAATYDAVLNFWYLVILCYPYREYSYSQYM